MSALQRRCWVGATIERVMVDGTCRRGQRCSSVVRAAGSGNILEEVRSLATIDIFGDESTTGIEVLWKNTALE